MVDYTKRPQQPSQPPNQPPNQPQAGGPNLSKVTLTKAAPSISLTKGAGAGGRMRINLNWSQGAAPAKGGFLKRAFAAGSGAVDLDLGCLWELSDGRKGGVQALGNAFGSIDGPPWVMLDGDDRSGTAQGGENLYVNLDRLGDIKRILVYAFIYEGVPNWAAADGVVTLHPVGAPPIEEVRLDEPAADRRACAIALLTNEGGSLQVRREVRYGADQVELDQAFGWGLNWGRGRK